MVKKNLERKPKMTICKKAKQFFGDSYGNIAILLADRERGFAKRSSRLSLLKIAEEKAATSEMQETHCQLPGSVRSTFLMSFSPDSSKVASTHGDHKIYICDVRTGRLLHKLEGHPRTPWCLAFHPTSNDILASGCLGGEVRVWDLHGGSEKWGAEHCTVITSLTFHPLDKVLVIATNNQIHFWDWSQPRSFALCKTNSEREKVRFVKFDRLGNRLITGISNINASNSRNSTGECSTAPQVHQTPAANSALAATRRTLLNRIMNMYRHIEGIEELARAHDTYGSHSPTEEDALNRARHYAQVTTQASRLEEVGRRFLAMEQLIQMEQATTPSLGMQPGTSHAVPDTTDSQSDRQGDITESSSAPVENNEDISPGEFWRTFQRLRTICSTLERTLQGHQRLQNNTESQVGSQIPSESPTIPANNSSIEPPTGSEDIVRLPNINTDSNSNGESMNRYITSGFLINVLTRIQNSLQFSALTTAIAQDQIQQVRLRLSEILERLSNVTGYRARLTNLRQQIFDVAERSEQRGDENTQRQRWDLAHCLWLVEMSLQLTRQMQRILQADYRLAQLHLSSTTSPSASTENSNVAENADSTSEIPVVCGSSRTPSTSSSQSPHNANTSTNQPTASATSLPYHGPRDTLNQLRNSRFQLMQVNREIELFHESFRSINNLNSSSEGTSERRSSESTPLLNNLRSNQPCSHVRWVQPNTRRTWPRVIYQSTRHDRQMSVIQPNRVTFATGDSELRREGSSAENPGSVQFAVRNSRGVPLRLRRNALTDLQGRAGLRSSSETSASARQSNFYIPEVLVENSPDSTDDAEPLPAHERPRSPPLSAILSGVDTIAGSYFSPYASMFYDAGGTPRLGIHESTINFTHRIQSWDFSKYEIPDISNAHSNVVVRKCKIHNDASVDISKDGQLLVALIPSRPTSVDPLVFGVYSLRPESLGSCLCTWGFESNAISVSLSPLGQYVVVGLASPRPYLSSPEKEAVAQIFKLKPVGKYCTTVHVRSLTQLINNENRYPQVSLNSVQWLPQPGQGLIYGTNRGCLCICKPTAPMTLKKNKIFHHNSLMQSSSISLGLHHGRNRNYHQVSTISTQTNQPLTHTTGTQTFSSENSGSGR